MEKHISDGPRRTWAPFVGAALAALTAGSLVVFALVAQRTSLDGFPELRIAAPVGSAAGRPVSITVAPVDGNADATRKVVSSDAADSTEIAGLTPPATTPLSLIPLVPATTPAAPLDLASLDTPVSAPSTMSGNRRPQSDDGLTFDGRFRADGELLAARNDGGSSDNRVRAGDSRGGGKHAHKSHDARSKKSKKGKKQKRSNHGAAHRRSRGRTHSHGPQGSSHAAAPSASRSSGSHSDRHQSAAPRPQPAPQGPPAHSNAGGNGKSNGKGHKKH